MRHTRYTAIGFLILAVFGCSVSANVPWFRYNTHWTPPQRSFEEQAATSLIHEDLYFFQVGPDMYPTLIQDTNRIQACYRAGSCNSHLYFDYPTRLHVAHLTFFERFQIQLIRLVGIGIFTTFGVGIFTTIGVVVGRRLRQLIRHLLGRSPYQSWRYLALVVLLTILSFAIGCFIILLMGPVFGQNFLQESLPSWGMCQTTAPVVECPSYTPRNSYYTLEQGTVQWEWSNLLPMGPILMILSFLLFLVAVNLWQHDDTPSVLPAYFIDDQI